MTVLAQIFDIMLPDRQTLIAEVKKDKEGLIQIFDARYQHDVEKAKKAAILQQENSVEPSREDQSAGKEVLPIPHEAEESKEESMVPLMTPEKTGDSIHAFEQQAQTPTKT